MVWHSCASITSNSSRPSRARVSSDLQHSWVWVEWLSAHRASWQARLMVLALALVQSIITDEASLLSCQGPVSQRPLSPIRPPLDAGQRRIMNGCPSSLESKWPLIRILNCGTTTCTVMIQLPG